MTCQRSNHTREGWTRRSFLGVMALAIGGTLTGCSSLRLILKTYPDKYDQDLELQTRLLTSFVRTVVPDAPKDGPHLTRIFLDDFFPFHEYCGFFLSDLSGTTRKLFGHENFCLLDLPDRTAVVARGLDKGGPAGKLFTSAVFMAQFSFYAGIYDDDHGCPLIEFPGANSGFRPNTMDLEEIKGHLAANLTTDGNPT